MVKAIFPVITTLESDGHKRELQCAALYQEPYKNLSLASSTIPRRSTTFSKSFHWFLCLLPLNCATTRWTKVKIIYIVPNIRFETQMFKGGYVFMFWFNVLVPCLCLSSAVLYCSILFIFWLSYCRLHPDSYRKFRKLKILLNSEISFRNRLWDPFRVRAKFLFSSCFSNYQSKT